MAECRTDPEQLREEMRSLVRRAAEPGRAGESVKAAIGRAARVLGLSYGRAKRYWYGEVQVPPAHEVDAARAMLSGRAPLPLVLVESPRSVPEIHVVYDENGRVWAAGSSELREGLGYTSGDFDVGGFAVRCLGWVEVRHSPGRIHVRIAPKLVQPKALDALYSLLSTVPKSEVELSVRVSQSWERELVATALDATARIDALVHGPESDGGPRFVSIRQPVSVLFRDKQRYLINMLQEARDLIGSGDGAAAVRFADADTTGRTSVAVASPVKGEKHRTTWSWEHIGSALRFYTPDERRRIIGADIRKAPDAEYGDWCAQAYDRAIATGEPIIEDVRALVFRRNAASLESRYRRMLIPFTGFAGRPVVLVTSDFRPLQRAA